MECVFGFEGDGFVLLATDTSAVQSIVVQKTTEDKIMILDSHKLMALTGESGDRVQFSEYIQKNVLLYQFRNGIPLSTAAAANFTRGELAQALRKSPYMVNMMIGGFDKDTGPSLYFLDYIATLHKVEKGALGYGAYFILSLLDKYYHKDLSLSSALDLAYKCIAEVRSRLVVSPPNFVIKIVDKDGARELEWRKTVEDIAAIPAE
ncbi:hypothetical protein O6H91_08G054400 [Diphasiastrum complanatum]|uniref:Uncharacterized protein n=1 Tax=Diphasiastrum complanatum TaxID=34168 RepID=A0ACC2CY35_DIPCM|nr:hypothetical protein O6H91_08G054400 [Diphasiastrum complanatum]